jgi:hypothetical protein
VLTGIRYTHFTGHADGDVHSLRPWGAGHIAISKLRDSARGVGPFFQSLFLRVVEQMMDSAQAIIEGAKEEINQETEKTEYERARRKCDNNNELRKPECVEHGGGGAGDLVLVR